MYVCVYVIVKGFIRLRLKVQGSGWVSVEVCINCHVSQGVVRRFRGFRYFCCGCWGLEGFEGIEGNRVFSDFRGLAVWDSKSLGFREAFIGFTKLRCFTRVLYRCTVQDLRARSMTFCLSLSTPLVRFSTMSMCFGKGSTPQALPPKFPKSETRKRHPEIRNPKPKSAGNSNPEAPFQPGAPKPKPYTAYT